MDDLTRLGPSETALGRYRELLEQGRGLTEQDPEFAELEAAGLVHRDPDGQVRANNPRWAVQRWADREEDRLTAVRQAGEQWEKIFQAGRPQSEPATEVTGEAVLQAFWEVQRIAQSQLRCLERGVYREDRPPVPDPFQVERMASGVKYRVVYDYELVQQDRMREEIYTCISAGERARTLSGVPARMMIADDRMAVLLHRRPGSEAEAVVVEPGLLLDSLIETFEVLWRLAIDINVPTWGRDGLEQEPTQATRELLAQMAAGLTDEAISRELQVSERTVHRRIRRLQDLLAARNRFQLCLQAVRRGWL